MTSHRKGNSGILAIAFTVSQRDNMNLGFVLLITHLQAIHYQNRNFSFITLAMYEAPSHSYLFLIIIRRR